MRCNNYFKITRRYWKTFFAMSTLKNPYFEKGMLNFVRKKVSDRPKNSKGDPFNSQNAFFQANSHLKKIGIPIDHMIFFRKTVAQCLTVRWFFPQVLIIRSTVPQDLKTTKDVTIRTRNTVFPNQNLKKIRKECLR